jgi:hypothetical protein
MALVINDYTVQRRLTKRHSWNIAECYYRLDDRNNTVETPPLPDDVAEEVKRVVCESITVRAALNRSQVTPTAAGPRRW